MAEKKFLVDLNLQGNQLKTALAEHVTSVATITSPAAGRFVFDESDKKFKYYNGSAWIAGAEYTASSMAADGASTFKVYDSTEGNNFKFRAVAASGKISVSQTGGVITFSLASDAFKSEIKSGAESVVATGLASGGNIKTQIDNTVSTAKTELIGKIGSDKDSDTIQGAKLYAGSLVDTAKTDLKGSDSDDKTSATIAGAKKYADSVAATAKSEAISTVEGTETDGKTAKTVAGAKAFATDAVNTAKTDLIGKTGSNKDSDTIQGAKIYADAAAAKVEAKLPVVKAGNGINVTPSTTSEGKTTYTITTDTSVFEFKGSKKNVSELPASGQDIGDVWAVQINPEDASAGHSLYAYDGDEWVNIGSAEGVQGVDTAAHNGVQLTFQNNAVGLNVTPGTVTEGNGSVVTGGAVKSAIDTTVNGLAVTEKTVTSAKNHVSVTYSETKGIVSVSVAENDIASAATVDTINTNLGAKGDAANAEGSAFARIAKNKADISTNATKIEDHETRIGTLEGKALNMAHSYSAECASGTTITAATHKCGTHPIVQAYLAGDLVEISVKINASGDVTPSYNGTANVTLHIIG